MDALLETELVVIVVVLVLLCRVVSFTAAQVNDLLEVDLLCQEVAVLESARDADGHSGRLLALG